MPRLAWHRLFEWDYRAGSALRGNGVTNQAKAGGPRGGAADSASSGRGAW
jgi:hypothetical protein